MSYLTCLIKSVTWTIIVTCSVHFFRVHKCKEDAENIPLQDPFPANPFSRRKKEICSKCTLKDKDNEETLSEQVWTKCTKRIPKSFSYLDILKFSEISGRSSSVEKPIDRGYRFFFDGYVFDEEVSSVKDKVTVKCCCFRSMKKNEPPHRLHVVLDTDGKVISGKCSCVAGVAGQCNHVYALLYKVEHVVKMKATSFERKKTCTEKASEWQKSRTDGIRSDPVVMSHVVKPKFGSEPSGIKPTLYEARAGNALGNLNIAGHLAKLQQINPLFGVCQTVGAMSSQVKTRNGLTVPKGSPLSYHLSITEGNFKVSDNVIPVVGKLCSLDDKPPPFPWGDTVIEPINTDLLSSAGVLLDDLEASVVCKNTVSQSDCEAWFEARKNRLTASRFGLIVKRKKDKQSFIRTTLLGKQDLSNVPAVKYGKQKENTAVKHYLEYMKTTSKDVKVYECGCVINSKFPWLAASPDRIVFHEGAGFGLMEVKCSYSKRNITPEEACFDPCFYCEMLDGKFTLKKNHEYYAQVQGQLGVCGAQYCDFVVFTEKGMGIQRITFDELFWTSMTEKLRLFYLQEFIPAVTSCQQSK